MPRIPADTLHYIPYILLNFLNCLYLYWFYSTRPQNLEIFYGYVNRNSGPGCNALTRWISKKTYCPLQNVLYVRACLSLLNRVDVVCSFWPFSPNRNDVNVFGPNSAYGTPVGQHGGFRKPCTRLGVNEIVLATCPENDDGRNRNTELPTRLKLGSNAVTETDPPLECSVPRVSGCCTTGIDRYRAWNIWKHVYTERVRDYPSSGGMLKGNAEFCILNVSLSEEERSCEIWWKYYKHYWKRLGTSICF